MTTPAETLTATQLIPLEHKEELIARIEKVNRRAAKLGAEPLTLTFGEVKDRVYTNRDGEANPYDLELAKALGMEDHFAVLREIEATVTGDAPRLPGGWKLLAVIDHREALPIVKNVPGHELPKGQRDRGPICDRCGKSRRRTDSFVLQNEAGEVTQVGRNCLADFLGHGGENALSLLNFWLAHVRGWFDDAEERDSYGPRPRPMIAVEAVVRIAAAVIDFEGWISRGRAHQTDEVSTASRVSEIVWPPDLSYYTPAARERYRAFRDDVMTRIDAMTAAEAKDAVAWAASHVESDSDYLRNLAVCAISKHVGADKFGLVVSLPAAYRREQDRLREAERKAKAGAASTYVGQPKERLELELTLTGQPRVFDGDYGTTYLAEFTDGDDIFVWWASVNPIRKGFEIGVPTKAKATVKKHEEFKGVKRTVVSRVAVAS